MIKPTDFGLPEKFTSFRENQLSLAAKMATTQKYCYMLDAPTGSGKSLTAATAQRISGKNVVYICTTKQLQDQLLHDFDYARTLKGRSNYVCLKYKNMYPRITAEECTKSEQSGCDYEDACPYMIAKSEALRAPLAVLNMSYFLTEANFVGTFSGQKLTIVDEADTLEEYLMSFVDVTITERILKQLEIPAPKYKTKFESWVDWARDVIHILEPRLSSLRNELSGTWSTTDINLIREEKRLSRLLAKLKFFVKEVNKDWVWYPQQSQWSFKPVWISKYADSTFWKHSEKVIMMSATILDYIQVCRNVGLDVNKVTYKALPSPFPKENRPVYLDYAAEVTHKTLKTALPKLAAKCQQILEQNPEEKILIHCVTYEIAEYLMGALDKRRTMTHGRFDREAMLESFKLSRGPRVLLSPSMDRGVDLPDDLCRIIVIVKVPYPNLGDPQINRRVHASKDGNSWYAHKTVSKIIQMCGRGVRSKSDWALTYIIDAKFDDIYRDNKRLFPSWFKEAILR